MARGQRFAGPPPVFGLNPHHLGARNGVEVPAPSLRTMYLVANELASKLTRHVFSWDGSIADSADPAGTEDTLRFRFRSSPGATKLRTMFTFISAGAGVAVGDSPRVYWTVNGAAGDPVYAPFVADALNGPQIYADITITPDTAYQMVLSQVAHARIRNVQVWEAPLATVANNAAGYCDPTPIYTGAPILAATHADLLAMIRGMARRQGQQFVAHSTPTSTPLTMTGTTYKNIVDGTTAGYSATAQGTYTWPAYQGSRSSTGVIPVEVYAYMKTTGAASTAYLKLVDSAGDIVELSTASTTGVWVTGTGNWTTSNASRLVQALSKNTGGGTSSIWAWGMYPYEA